MIAQMLDFLRGWVTNLIALALFIVLLEIILPSGKTKKFVNLIAGFVLVIAIVRPFIQLFSIAEISDLKAFQITDSSFLDRKEIEESSKVLQEEQVKQITEVYRKKLIAGIEAGLEGTEGVSELRADVMIYEDHLSKDYGQIKRIYLYLQPESKQDKQVAKIGKIEIEKGRASGQESSAIDEGLQKSLEEKVSRMMGVDAENIVITEMK